MDYGSQKKVSDILKENSADKPLKFTIYKGIKLKNLKWVQTSMSKLFI